MPYGADYGVYTDYANSLARERFGRYVDQVTGMVSYSGADYKAIVFLPIDREAINELLEKRSKEKTELESELKAAESEYQALADALAYNQVYAPENVPATLLRLRTLQNGPGEFARMRLQLERLNASISELQSATGKSNVLHRAIVLGDLQTLSFSLHREKFPVRTFGRVSPKSYTRGPRTIAGSLIFTVFHKQALYDILQQHLKFYNTGVKGTDGEWPTMDTIVPDQLPPFDITIVASNEAGDSSYMVLYGVEIVNEGQTMSIQDILTENVMQFVCRDIEELQPMGNRFGKQSAASAPSLTATELSRRQTERQDPFK